MGTQGLYIEFVHLRLKKGRKPRIDEPPSPPGQTSILSHEFKPHSNQVWGWNIGSHSRQGSGVESETNAGSADKCRWRVGSRRPGSPFPAVLAWGNPVPPLAAQRLALCRPTLTLTTVLLMLSHPVLLSSTGVHFPGIIC